jgi:hypothetical protein
MLDAAAGRILAMRKHTSVDAIWSVDVNGADRHLSTSGTNNGLTDRTSPPKGR